MARHVYLERAELEAPADFSGAVFAVVFVLAVSGGATAVVTVPVVGGLVAIVLILLAASVRVLTLYRPQVAREIRAAQLERLREQLSEAVTRCRALLRTRLPPIVRGQVLVVLGECAELAGDFAEAADIYVRAEGMFRAARIGVVARAQSLAVVAARRAFAHAACGELDRAEATLRTASAPDGVPLAGAFSSRAALLVLARRGLHQQVVERLAADARLFRSTLGARDRALVAVIAAFATSRELPSGSVDSTFVPWIGRAFPESRAMLGVVGVAGSAEGGTARIVGVTP